MSLRIDRSLPDVLVLRLPVPWPVAKTNDAQLSRGEDFEISTLFQQCLREVGESAAAIHQFAEPAEAVK